MLAVTWTALGLLAATLFGALFWLGGRIDQLSARIDAQGARLEARIDAQGARIDTLTRELAAYMSRHAG